MGTAFDIVNDLLNAGYIVDNVLPSQVEHVVEQALQVWEGSDEIFVVCFGRGNDDWILARANEVGRHLSNSCTNFVYPLKLVRRSATPKDEKQLALVESDSTLV